MIATAKHDDKAKLDLDRFREAREHLLAAYGLFLQYCPSPEWDMQDVVERLQEHLTRLQNETFEVIVFGEFKHGKSTFLNALMQQDHEVCPTRAVPETAKVSRIQAVGKNPEMRGNYFIVKATSPDVGRGPYPLTPGALRPYVSQKGDYTKHVDSIEIFLEAKDTPLACGAVFVDTPGLKSVFADHDRITNEYVKRADAVVFFFSGTQPFSGDEKAFLEGHAELGNGPGTLYVMNRIDQMGGEDEVEEAAKYIKEQLEDLEIELKPEGSHEMPQFFPVSAKQAFEHGPWRRDYEPSRDDKKYAESRFDRLRQFLFEALTRNKGAILVESALKEQRGLLRAMEISITSTRKLLARLRLEASDLKKRKRAWVVKREALNDSGGRIRASVRSGAAGIKSRYASDVETFVKELKVSIWNELQSLDAAAVKEQIPKFISKRSKVWMTDQEASLRTRFGALASQTKRDLSAYVKEVETAAAEALGFEPGVLDLEEIGSPFGDAMEYVGAGGGAALVGAGIGLAVGGPVGAAIGAGIGAVVGALGRWVFGNDWRTDAHEKICNDLDAHLAPALRSSGHYYLLAMEENLLRVVDDVIRRVFAEIERQIQVVSRDVEAREADTKREEAKRSKKDQALATLRAAVEKAGAIDLGQGPPAGRRKTARNKGSVSTNPT